MEKLELVTLLSETYRHLYDLVYLGNCRLAELFFPDGAMRRKDKAWQLQRILLEAIEELNAPPNAAGNTAPNLPAFSREWRRYRLMVMHYVDGTDPKSVSEQLSISRRHYYREHDLAIEMVAAMLQQRLTDLTPATAALNAAESAHNPQRRLETASQDAAQNAPQSAAVDRSTLLRAEIARATQTVQRANLNEAVQSVIRVLQEQLNAHQVCVELTLNQLPDVAIDRGLLRHLLISATQHLAKTNSGATLSFCVTADQDCVNLNLSASSASGANEGALRDSQRAALEDAQTQRAAIQELADMSHARVTFGPSAITLTLPIFQKRTVLIIDDNADLTALFQNWLDEQGYSALVAHSAREGIELARRVKPFAVLLDLMMPDQDGWEVLQTMSTQPDLNPIPVIVCSVLRQEDLALSLGASGFLLKPVTKQDLLSRLEELQARYPTSSGPVAPHYRA